MRRFDDRAVQQFLSDGYVRLQTELPESFHQEVYSRLERYFAEVGNPGNNLLPLLPQLMAIFEDPAVAEALESLFGPGWYLHPHRHPHRNAPGSKGQQMHKDAWTRRHHPTRWGMLFYYPQHTPEERGPSGVQPGSHYYNRLPEQIPELPLSGPAGTVAIVHYDLWHRAMPNRTEEPRFMLKFLLARTVEPERSGQEPSSTPWTDAAGPLDQRLYRRCWAWHRGAGWSAGASEPPTDRDALRTALHSPDETEQLNAAYALADAAEESRALLEEALLQGDETVQRAAAYGLIVQGEPAVGTLRRLARSEDVSVRTLAVDALGAMGIAAESGVGTLIDATLDPDVAVRRRAVEGIGTAAQRSGEGVAALARALSDPDDWVRRNAALALIRLAPHAEKAVPDLRRALTDPNRYVRANAAEALSRIDRPDAQQAAWSFLKTARWCPDTSPASTY